VDSQGGARCKNFRNKSIHRSHWESERAGQRRSTDGGFRAHGVENLSGSAFAAREACREALRGHHHCVSLTENFSDAFIYEKPVKIAAIPHLFNTSERRATELGKAIRELFLNGQGSSIRGAKSRVDL
jgi:hypothetical protein